MPTERFLNLPAEKRERILAAAVGEFTRAPYDAVSINKIIRAAGIPRGSFYQYFTGKRDLLEHIMHGFGARMLQSLAEGLAAGGGDVFEAVCGMLRTAIGLVEEYGNRDFFRNVFSCARQSDGETFAFTRGGAGEVLDKLGGRVDFSGFRDTSPAALRDAAEILETLLRFAVIKVYTRQQEAGEVMAGFERKLTLIKQGLLREGGEA